MTPSVCSGCPTIRTKTQSHSLTVSKEIRRQGLWLKAKKSRIIESSDRSAWSESHNHNRLAYFQAMLAGTVALPPSEFADIFSKMKAGIDTSGPLGYATGTKKRAAEFRLLAGSVTFQGFTIFADTAAHRGM